MRSARIDTTRCETSTRCWSPGRSPRITARSSRARATAIWRRFPRAGDAVAAAAEIQRRISRRNEDSEVALGVRIGLSAGDVIERAGDYHGVPVIEAARLCAAATGGQILASETVRSLVGSRGGHDFVALGELDLKGLPPLATAAVRWCDDAPVFAPSGGAKGNLPASLDRFIGRQGDLDAIRALLGERRLVTLTGTGGSGKTRLALEVARSIGAEHADGVWLVDLAPIDDEKLIAEATMAALGLRGSDAAARDVLRSHLGGRDTVLLVDNCEQVLDGAATLIAELLAGCPLLSVVATSREPLRVPGEAEYAVEGLGREEAAELFAERVPGRRRIDDRDAIARICAALEGIPLALELAAAKLRVLCERRSTGATTSSTTTSGPCSDAWESSPEALDRTRLNTSLPTTKSLALA